VVQTFVAYRVYICNNICGLEMFQRPYNCCSFKMLLIIFTEICSEKMKNYEIVTFFIQMLLCEVGHNSNKIHLVYDVPVAQQATV